LPPPATYNALALAVTEKPPFTLLAKFDAATFVPGKPAGLTVTVNRTPEFTAEVVLTATGQPANITPALKNIPAKMNEVKASFTLTAKAAVGTYAIVVSGKAKHNNKEFSVHATPISLVVKKK